MSDIDLSERPVYFGSLFTILKFQYFQKNVITWLIVITIFVIDCIWMRLAGFTIPHASVMRSTTGLLSLTVITLILYWITFIPRYADLVVRLRIRKICTIAHAIVLFLFFAYVSLILQYLCVSLGRPLIDKELIALDAALGFYWRDLFVWQMRQHFFSAVLTTVYLSYVYQVAITAVALGFAGLADDLADFMLLFVVIAVLTILISTPLPASNPLFHFGFVGPHDVSPWSKFYSLREGSMTDFGLDNEQGLISIPSLHAAHAILFAYAVRRMRWLFPISIAWNVTMIYSAIPFGAHYLIDIIAGVALSVAAIMVARYLKRRFEDKTMLVPGERLTEGAQRCVKASDAAKER